MLQLSRMTYSNMGFQHDVETMLSEVQCNVLHDEIVQRSFGYGHQERFGACLCLSNLTAGEDSSFFS